MLRSENAAEYLSTHSCMETGKSGFGGPLVLGTDHPTTYTIIFVCVVGWSADVIAIIIARVMHAGMSKIARCESECYLPSCLHYEGDLSQLLQQTILSQINPTLLTSSTRVQPLACRLNESCAHGKER